MHLVHPQKFVFNFSWDDCHTQEKFAGNNGHEFFFLCGGGGGRGAMCILVYVKMVNNKLLAT